MTDTTEALLVEGIEKLYHVEQQLVDALETLAEETNEELASEAFAEHREETMGQVERLEEVFQVMDLEPEAREEPLIDVLIEEHEAFSQENEGEVLDRYNMSAAKKTEHIEIAAYDNLTSMAGELGYDEVVDLLEESLEEERAALEELEEASETFDQRQIAP